MFRIKGLTLVELMIVVAIIAVLGAIAGPSYYQYITRSQITEVLGLTGNAKKAMSEYIINYGAYPAGSTEAGIVLIKTEALQEMQVNDSGRITLVIDPVNVGINLQIHLQASVENFGVSWSCTSSGEVEYAPSSCR